MCLGSSNEVSQWSMCSHRNLPYSVAVVRYYMAVFVTVSSISPLCLTRHRHPRHAILFIIFSLSDLNGTRLSVRISFVLFLHTYPSCTILHLCGTWTCYWHTSRTSSLRRVCISWYFWVRIQHVIFPESRRAPVADRSSRCTDAISTVGCRLFMWGARLKMSWAARTACNRETRWYLTSTRWHGKRMSYHIRYSSTRAPQLAWYRFVSSSN